MWRKTAFLIVLIMLAVPVLAAEGGHEGNPILGISFRVLNLVLFFGLLVYLAARPIRGFFEKHTEGIQEELAASLEQELKAKRLAQEAEALQAGVDAEVEKVRRRFEEERQRLGSEMRAYTQTALARLKDEHVRGAAHQEEEFRRNLAAYALDAARKESAAYLQAHLTPDDRSRFLDGVAKGR